MHASPLLLFESSLFAAQPGEDALTNPGIFGRSLAHWLGQRLVSADFSEEDVIAEDFGWLVPVPNQDMGLYVACSSTGAASGEWRVFAFAEAGIIGRLFKRQKPDELLVGLYAKVKDTLEGTTGIAKLREEPSLDR